MKRFAWWKLAGLGLIMAGLSGCVIVPVLVSGIVGPVEGRPVVKLNSTSNLPTPAPTADPSASPAGG